MAKKSKNKNKGRKRSRAETTMTTMRITAATTEKQQQQEPHKNDTIKLSRQERTAWLTHDTREKREEIKLKLHLTKTRRKIDELRHRLTHWDPAELPQEQQQQQQQQSEAEQPPPKKKGRKGPETWKLKGAARPAWQVYDFDTRFVDPHIENHKKAKEKQARQQDLLTKYRGRFGQVVLLSSNHCHIESTECREFLALLMQLGYLCLEKKQYKSAREAWLECMELEGIDDNHPITDARTALMKLYVHVRKYNDAYQLAMQLWNHETSVWIRYHGALVAILLQKDNSNDLLTAAIQTNVFCAYYLSYYETFDSVMEYTDELEAYYNSQQDDSDEPLPPQSTLEEAIEYCTNSSSNDHIKLWTQEGEPRQMLRQALDNIPDLDWNGRLSKIEQEYQSRGINNGSNKHDDPIDLSMFAEQFRTGMEMLVDAGHVVALTTTSPSSSCS